MHTNGQPKKEMRINPGEYVDMAGYEPVQEEAGMLLYAPGYPVEIGMGGDKFAGIVTAVTIYPYKVAYKVAWWDGRDRIEEWLTEAEVAPLDHHATKTRVGFAR